MLDLRLLQTFAVVVQEGSMIDAASVLGCTAPAVSQQISRLEREFGARLLERLPGGVVPTAIGDVLIRHAVAMLHSVDELQRAVEVAKDPEHGRLRISAFSSASAHLLPSAIGAFRRKRPSVRITLDDSDWPRPFDALLSRTTDVAIVPEFDYVPVLVPHGISSVLVGSDPFRVVLPWDSPLAAKRVVRFRDLKDAEFISFSSRFPHDVTLRQAAAEAGFVPNVTSEINDYDVLPALVAAGVGCAIATSLMLGRIAEQNIAVRRLVGPAVERKVFMATRSDDPPPFMTEIEQDLRRTLAEVVAGQ